MMKWINVETQLPENDDDVLCYHAHDFHITVGFYDKDNVSYYYESDGTKFYTDSGWETEIPWAPKGSVTHWMPLPDPPEQIKTALGKHDLPARNKSTQYLEG